MNGIVPLLRKLKQNFDGKFIISQDVKREAMDYPETVKRFELEALQLEALFKDNIIEMPKLNPVQQKEFEKMKNEVMTLANSTFFAENKNIHIIDKGEASALALSKVLDDSNVIAIDERTTRMLCENPENLKKLLQKKLHTNITSNKKNYEFFKKFKVIRSTELIYMANKLKLFDLKDPRTLDAMLYATKYKGCSVSEEEIEEIKRM
jgi:hypothetical protein